MLRYGVSDLIDNRYRIKISARNHESGPISIRGLFTVSVIDIINNNQLSGSVRFTECPYKKAAKLLAIARTQ